MEAIVARPFDERVQAMNSAIVAKCNATVKQGEQDEECQQGFLSLKRRMIGRLHWNQGHQQWHQGHQQWNS